MTLQIVNWDSLTADAQEACLQRPAVNADEDIRRSVAAILSAVRQSGDAAVRQFTAEFDGVDLQQTSVSKEEIRAAGRHLSTAEIDAIDVAIANVRQFHWAQKARDIRVETMPGVVCERISHPIDAVGLYVPAGTAPLPSAAIMLAVPAQIAACPEVVLCTPPRSDGSADPGVLVAASRAGVSRIFKIGGAQAIAAMAFGTRKVPKVDKLFGPGNAFVTSAKSQVSMHPNGASIDMPAGPSEVMVIADQAANAEFVASDLLSQAEHGSDSQVILLTESQALAERVQDEVKVQLEALDRATIAAQALANSTIIVLSDLAAAIQLANRYAPEHLIVQIADPRGVLDQIRNAGSVFLGAWTPESVGDYCSGTNHVLPTYGAAKTYSGLGVDQFMRYMTVQELSRDGLQQLGNTVVTLAQMEGLDAHASAVQRRLRNRQ